MPNTLVIGCESFLGRCFHETYKRFHPTALGTHYKYADPSRRIELSCPDLRPLRLKKGEYKYALVAAASTSLQQCEREKERSFDLNVEGTLTLVRALIDLEIVPILFSSAYVFDGSHGKYTEDSASCPINEYGRQKAQLEKRIKEVCGTQYLMIRCSKIFDLAKGGKTLLDEICSNLLLGQEVRAATDQIFCPILADDVVQAVISLQQKGCRGLYNVCGMEAWSRYDLAKKMATRLQIDPDLVVSISLDDLDLPYLIPKRTDLDCTKLLSEVSFQTASVSSCINKIEELYLNEVDYGASAVRGKKTLG